MKQDIVVFIHPLIKSTMKKLSVFFAILAFFPVIYANNLIYCPDSIQCTRPGDATSCKYLGDSLEYWDKLRDNWRIKKGIYKFRAVDIRYHYSSDSYSMNCQYGDKNGFIFTYNKKEVNLEPYLGNNNKWLLFKYDGICVRNSSKECPFTLRQTLGNSTYFN